MICEFTGPTAAGKTTLMAATADCLKSMGVPIGVVHEQMENPCPLIPLRLSNPLRHDAITDLLLLPWMAGALIRQFQLFSWIAWMTITLKQPLSDKHAILRSVCRKAALRRYLEQPRFSGWIILVDEGLTHAGHNFLVGTGVAPDPASVSRFAEWISLPEATIVVQAPEDELQERTRMREDRSPRIALPGTDRRFVANAIRLYDELRRSWQQSPGVIFSDGTDPETLAKRILDRWAMTR